MLPTLTTAVPHQVHQRLLGNVACKPTAASARSFTSIISRIRPYAVRVARILCRPYPQLPADDLVQDTVIALQYYCRLPNEAERAAIMLHAKPVVLTTLRYVFANQKRILQRRLCAYQGWSGGQSDDLDTTQISLEETIMTLRQWLQHCTPHQRELWLMLATF